MAALNVRLVAGPWVRRLAAAATVVAATVFAFVLLDVDEAAPFAVEHQPPTASLAPGPFDDVTVALPSVVRPLPPPAGPIGRALAQHRAALEACRVGPTLNKTGTVKLRWRISVGGRVETMRVLRSSVDHRWGRCLARVVARIPFHNVAPPEGAWVTHTFKLRPRRSPAQRAAAAPIAVPKR